MTVYWWLPGASEETVKLQGLVFHIPSWAAPQSFALLCFPKLSSVISNEFSVRLFSFCARLSEGQNTFVLYQTQQQTKQQGFEYRVSRRIL